MLERGWLWEGNEEYLSGDIGGGSCLRTYILVETCKKMVMRATVLLYTGLEISKMDYTQESLDTGLISAVITPQPRWKKIPAKHSFLIPQIMGLTK
jgi:hypothetical protein